MSPTMVASSLNFAVKVCMCLYFSLCIITRWVRVNDLWCMAGLVSGACWALATVGHGFAPHWTLLPLPGMWVPVGSEVRGWMFWCGCWPTLLVAFAVLDLVLIRGGSSGRLGLSPPSFTCCLWLLVGVSVASHPYYQAHLWQRHTLFLSHTHSLQEDLCIHVFSSLSVPGAVCFFLPKMLNVNNLIMYIFIQVCKCYI